jgi:hypothetical protein
MCKGRVCPELSGEDYWKFLLGPDLAFSLGRQYLFKFVNAVITSIRIRAEKGRQA